MMTRDKEPPLQLLRGSEGFFLRLPDGDAPGRHRERREGKDVPAALHLLVGFMAAVAGADRGPALDDKLGEAAGMVAHLQGVERLSRVGARHDHPVPVHHLHVPGLADIDRLAECLDTRLRYVDAGDQHTDDVILLIQEGNGRQDDAHGVRLVQDEVGHHRLAGGQYGGNGRLPRQRVDIHVRFERYRLDDRAGAVRQHHAGEGNTRVTEGASHGLHELHEPLPVGQRPVGCRGYLFHVEQDVAQHVIQLRGHDPGDDKALVEDLGRVVVEGLDTEPAEETETEHEAGQDEQTDTFLERYRPEKPQDTVKRPHNDRRPVAPPAGSTPPRKFRVSRRTGASPAPRRA